jgi:hypothetical protein
MARARNIKPGFFSNDDLVELPFEARLLFIGLWTIADREGRLLDRPRKIKMDVFPGDSVDVESCLDQLANAGFIHRYDAAGTAAVQIVKWAKHQNPHVKEAASTICAPDTIGASTEQAPDLHDATTEQAPPIPEPTGLIPDSLNLIPDSPNPSTTSSPTDDVRQCPAGSIIDLYHTHLPDNPRVKVLSAARKSAIRARWAEAAKLDCWPFGYASKSAGLEAWRNFFEVCAESRFLTGQSTPIPGKPVFIADVDFLFSASGFAKTLEEKYHRDAQ